MNIIADKMKLIKPSPTIAVTNKAAALKAQGVDIIGLGAGEPDLDTPNNIKLAAIKAIQEGKTKYTQIDGIAELKKAIIQKFNKENNIDYNINQITVANGAKQVIYNAFTASLNESDEVIIPAPFWVSYPDMVAIAGGKSVIIDCIDSGFKLTKEKLKEYITSNTKWVIINSPSNPTGVSYTKEELLELAEVLKDYPNIYILSDDIYEHLMFDSMKFYTLAEIAPNLKDRILTVNGVSKSYSMTGWRIGYAGGPEDLIKAMAVIQSQSTSNPCTISQYAALEALQGDQSFLQTNKSIFETRRDLTFNILNNTENLSVTKPNGAFYLFINCKSCFNKVTDTGIIIQNSNDIAEYLLQNGVAVVPGIAFGAEGYFRISYALDNKILEQACYRIQQAIEKLKTK